jgi:hypothetical protein
MANKNISVFGIYGDPAALEKGLESFRLAGFRAADLAVLHAEESAPNACYERHTKAPEGVAAGAALGTLLGAAFGWLAASEELLSALAGIDPFVTALAGAGVGLLLGGFLGLSLGLFEPEYEAKRYSGELPHDCLLVSAHCDSPSWAKWAKRLFRRTGATDISVAREARADFMSTDQPRPRTRLPRTRFEY